MNDERSTTLSCCIGGRMFISLRHVDLPHEHSNRDEFLAWVRATPPVWFIAVRPVDLDAQREYSGLLFPERSLTCICCPFCATPVPRLRLRADPPKSIATCFDGGYNCATCKKSLRSCECLSPSELWEVIP